MTGGDIPLVRVRAVHFLAQPFQGLTGVMGHVRVFGVRQSVQVRPEERQRFRRDKLNRLVHSLRIVAAKALAEPLQGLAFA